MCVCVCVCVCVCAYTVTTPNGYPFQNKQNMISEADKNGDGMVSEQEFVEVMLKTVIFNYV